MNKEPILFDVDIIKEYADKRIGLKEEDVKDLLKCLIGYLKQRVQKGDTYAITLPSIGVLHKKASEDGYRYESISFKDKNDENMLVEFALLGFLSVANKKPKFDNNNRKELQSHTNNEID